MNTSTDNRNTILIVDDEEMNLKVLNAFLRDDYDVYTVSSGAAAISRVRDTTPDLIILDTMMPEMDGFEVLSVLKNNEKTCNIPVILITGLDSKEDEEKGILLNAADYLSKPFNAGIVKQCVHNHIQIVNQTRSIEKLSALEQVTGMPDSPNPEEKTTRKKIIHVDDVTYTLMSLKGRLEKHFEIYSVHSHEQLFKLLENVTPDLILLDLKMPGADGFEVIQELKANPELKVIPVVFLTSISDDASIEKCKELGAADVVIKPISDAELIKYINDAIGYTNI